MAFEYEVVDVPNYNPCELAQILYPNLSLEASLDAYFEELSKREKYIEFWSDPCWSE